MEVLPGTVNNVQSGSPEGEFTNQLSDARKKARSKWSVVHLMTHASSMFQSLLRAKQEKRE